MKILHVFGFLLLTLVMAAQEGEFFKVELVPRTPEVEDLVQSFEGTSVVPIMAANLQGNQVGVLDQRGKTIVLWFWKLDCDLCIQQIDILNRLQSELGDLKIISYADNNKEELLRFAESTNIEFDVIPNAGMISEGPYGGELGYPKMFVVDEKQIIRWVFPSKDYLSPKWDTYNIIKTLYLQLNP